MIEINEIELATKLAHDYTFREFEEEVGYDETLLFNNGQYKRKYQESFNGHYDFVLNMINTCRNSNSAADNVKHEQVINQEQMMAQIEDIAVDLAETICFKYIDKSTMELGIIKTKNSLAFEHFQQELRDCFAMHFKADSKPVNVSDEQDIGFGCTSGIRGIKHSNKRPEKLEFLVDDKELEQSITNEELVSKIKTLGLDLILSINFNGKINDNLFTDFQKDVDKLFKTYRIMSNSDQNNSDDK